MSLTESAPAAEAAPSEILLSRRVTGNLTMPRLRVTAPDRAVIGAVLAFAALGPGGAQAATPVARSILAYDKKPALRIVDPVTGHVSRAIAGRPDEEYSELVRSPDGKSLLATRTTSSGTVLMRRSLPSGA